MEKNKLNKIMILGSGPVSIQVAVLLKKYKSNVEIGISGRGSKASIKTCEDIKAAKMNVDIKVQNQSHKKMSGEVKINYVFSDYESIVGKWKTLILATPCDAYSQVLERVPEFVLRNVKTVVLVSPCIGSTAIVLGFFKTLCLDIEVVTCSTYLAATKREKGSSMASAVTKNKKRKIYIASTRRNSDTLKIIKRILIDTEIKTVILGNGFAVEARNVSTYVHPPLLFNDFALEHIFNIEAPVAYTYKFFPEGPITQYVMRDMLQQLSEIRNILAFLKIRKFNFLSFLNNDIYPVKEESLSQDDIKKFEGFGNIKKEYLLYIRYASILVDPYSVPDENGRYFDFSAVPLQKVYKVGEKRWEIPRMPGEDFYRLYLLKGLADIFNIPVETIEKYMKRYLNRLNNFKNSHSKELVFGKEEIKIYEKDLNLIKICLKEV